MTHMLFKLRYFILGLCLSLVMSLDVPGRERVVCGDSYRYVVREDGTLDSLFFRHFDVGFFQTDGKRGPSFYVHDGQSSHRSEWAGKGDLEFDCVIRGVKAELAYLQDKEYPSFSITLTNMSSETFAPVKAGLALGIDTYMEDYPAWLTKFFPTLMRNEPTHFYGYLQSPQGNVLGVVCKEPVASWSVDYNLSYYDIPQYWFYGHRIESLNLDLINTLPLPEHNPQDLWKLNPGESRRWTISLIPSQSLDTFEQAVASGSGIPMVKIDRTSYFPGETASIELIQLSDDRPSVRSIGEKGNLLRADVGYEGVSQDLHRWRVRTELPEKGRYDVEIVSEGYRNTAVLLANDTWENVLRNARRAAWDNHQKPSSHVESWYGFHSAFLAAGHFPDRKLDSLLDERFDMIYAKVFDPVRDVPVIYEDRIQNTSSTIGMLVDRYQAYGRLSDLEHAAGLADWLISDNQAADGAYMNGGVRYTSVIYVAKSLMELYLMEKELGKKDIRWRENAGRHYASVARAIDELVESEGDFQTEGEMTFEDGMIACSALQIGLFALLQTDPQRKQHYTQAMLRILDSHDCLTQLKVNDARRRGGTMRFWEAQYDVLMLPNMFNSPHGWSAWRAYASYYAYLLTGQEKYLVETFNAAGAFAALLENGTGKLRWAFVVDPYLQVRQIAAPVEGLTFDDLTTGNPHPEYHGARSFVIGEQYVDMISSWQPVNSQDNDVHEVFKFIEEAVLSNAFIVEREDGSIAGYNCRVSRHGRRLVVEPYERQIVNLHTNIRSDYKVIFNTQDR